MQSNVVYVTKSRIHHKPRINTTKQAQNEKRKKWNKRRQDTRSMFCHSGSSEIPKPQDLVLPKNQQKRLTQKLIKKFRKWRSEFLGIQKQFQKFQFYQSLVKREKPVPISAEDFVLIDEIFDSCKGRKHFAEFWKSPVPNIELAWERDAASITGIENCVVELPFLFTLKNMLPQDFEFLKIDEAFGIPIFETKKWMYAFQHKTFNLLFLDFCDTEIDKKPVYDKIVHQIRNSFKLSSNQKNLTIFDRFLRFSSKHDWNLKIIPIFSEKPDEICLDLLKKCLVSKLNLNWPFGLNETTIENYDHLDDSNSSIFSQLLKHFQDFSLNPIEISEEDEISNEQEFLEMISNDSEDDSNS